jgi:PAS domain S-box-containing protein
MRTAGVARSTHVLILAPAGRDAALTQAVLGHAGIASAVCANLDELCRALMAGAAHGVAAAIITEEGLIEGDVAGLARWIADQDPWSDLPFVVLLDRRTSSADGAEQFAFLRTAANITLLERPVHGATLVSAVKAALRARGRQYEVHDTLKALEESEQRYRTLADSLPQLVWTCRPDGTCDYLSRQWLDYTGIPESEQRDLSWPDLAIHPDDRERVSECWSAAIGGSGDYDLELRIRGASGDYRWFKTRGTPLRDAEGRIAKWFGTCTDISEIVVARETSARSRAELESLVTARTKSLAEANNLLMKEIAERERAEDALRQTQKLESLGQLTSGVAHDFNNLLTAVLGNIDLATRRIDDEATMRPLRGAIRAAERGAKLTTQLLAFSRKQRLAPKPVDLNLLVSEAGDMLFRTMGTTVRVETMLEPGLWPALIDPNQIELVLINLAINGRDAMAEGGRLTIRTANVPADARPSDLPPGDYVMIAVADTGTGMTEQVRARAFEPFFTTKEVGKGSGLGLSMVHGLAVQSGGNVYIDSRVGHGTTVRLYVPRASGEPGSGHQRQASDLLSVGKATILVVDDDAGVREIAVNALHELGYRTLEAENGQAALDRLAQGEPIDLLLVDVAMPGMNGVEMVRRARERYPTLRALFATGYADIDAFEHGGSDLLLQKPYRLETLADLVRRALLRDVPAGMAAPNVVPIKPSPSKPSSKR